MAGITSVLTNQAKIDMFAGALLIATSNVQTGNCFTTTNTLVNQLTNTFPLYVGMTIAFTNQNAANTTFVQRIINSTAIEMSEPPTGAAQQSMTFSGDTLKIALIRATGIAGTYDRTTTCYANIVTTSDECTGSGYTANGVSLTVSSTYPDVIDSNTAIVSFSNPSWTTVSINAAGCMIYTTGVRSGKTGNVSAGVLGVSATGITNASYHAIGVFDFGGTQQVTAGTFTINMPTANGTAAVLRVA